MRLAPIIALVLTVGIRADAARKTWAAVPVYVANSNSVPVFVRSQAQGRATAMFAEIGVDIQWRSGTPGPSSANGAILMEFASSPPAGLLPGALAYALPFEGTHIKLFPDRMPRRSPALLAYVMVHEISHILEGLARHSETGIMKARWSPGDLGEIERFGLPFASEDVILIHDGILQRDALLARHIRFIEAGN